MWFPGFGAARPEPNALPHTFLMWLEGESKQIRREEKEGEGRCLWQTGEKVTFWLLTSTFAAAVLATYTWSLLTFTEHQKEPYGGCYL